MVMPRGVSLSELESGGHARAGPHHERVFKENGTSRGPYFWIAAGIVVVIIIGLIFFFSQAGTATNKTKLRP